MHPYDPHHKPRRDAVIVGGAGRQPRRYVLTTDATIWVGTWEEFRKAGGCRHWNEDQTEIVLTVPEPYKLSIKFPGDDS